MAVGVYIADSNGSNAVNLTDESEPYPIPVINRTISNQTSVMRPGVSAAGRLVSRPAGARYADVTFSVKYLTQAMVTAILAKIDTYPPVPVEFSVDNGATQYLATWAEDGFAYESWTSDPSKFSGSFHLHILGLNS